MWTKRTTPARRHASETSRGSNALAPESSWMSLLVGLAKPAALTTASSPSKDVANRAVVASCSPLASMIPLTSRTEVPRRGAEMIDTVQPFDINSLQTAAPTNPLPPSTPTRRGPAFDGLTWIVFLLTGRLASGLAKQPASNVVPMSPCANAPSTRSSFAERLLQSLPSIRGPELPTEDQTS